jgi:hypothetical protein
MGDRVRNSKRKTRPPTAPRAIWMTVLSLSLFIPYLLSVLLYSSITHRRRISEEEYCEPEWILTENRFTARNPALAGATEFQGFAVDAAAARKHALSEVCRRGLEVFHVSKLLQAH